MEIRNSASNTQYAFWGTELALMDTKERLYIRFIRYE